MPKILFSLYARAHNACDNNNQRLTLVNKQFLSNTHLLIP